MTVERAAIVTAAGRGIGAAVAAELAGRGYRLAVLSPSGAPAAVRTHGALGVAGSVTHPADLARVVDAALQRFGRVDAVVNSTGHPPRGRLLELTDADWLAGVDLLPVEHRLNRARLGGLAKAFRPSEQLVGNITAETDRQPRAGLRA